MCIEQQIYSWANEQSVDVLLQKGLCAPGLTMRVAGGYGIFLDMQQIDTLAMLQSVLVHEQGYCATGALHKVCSPYELWQKNEEAAHRWAIRRYLPLPALRQALAEGITEAWELAEHFGLLQQDVERALRYYTETQGEQLNGETQDAPS